MVDMAEVETEGGKTIKEGKDLETNREVEVDRTREALLLAVDSVQCRHAEEKQ
jgi:hypothetical protein